MYVYILKLQYIIIIDTDYKEMFIIHVIKYTIYVYSKTSAE